MMKAAVIFGSGDIRIEERPVPKPGRDEVLIKIHACGVCGTDNSLFRGAYPAFYPVIIGHEFAGEVVEIGDDVKTHRIGDRVTVDPNRVCHKCFYCQSGLDHLCDNLRSMGVHIDGANAEYCVMSEGNVYNIGSSLSYEEAAFTEPLACAIHGTDLAQVKLGDTVLVIGAGGMGNLIVQCVRNSGAANIIVSEPIQKRRETAITNGATHVLDPNSCDVASEVRKIKTVGADVVFEVAGNLAVQAMCPTYCRKGGSVVLFGVSPQNGLADFSPFMINENELKIIGSFNNRAATSRAVDLLTRKYVRVDNLISHRFTLKNYLDVFGQFGKENTIKLMVNIF